MDVGDPYSSFDGSCGASLAITGRGARHDGDEMGGRFLMDRMLLQPVWTVWN